LNESRTTIGIVCQCIFVAMTILIQPDYYASGVCYCPQTRVPGERFKIELSSS